MPEPTRSQRFTVSHLDEADFKAGGLRDYSAYRDLGIAAATDGSIGKVDKHSDDVGSAHLVVDTCVWIFGKHVLLPAGTVQRIDADERKIYVALTKDQIKDSPEFDKDKHVGDAGYHEQIGGYYEGNRGF